MESVSRLQHGEREWQSLCGGARAGGSGRPRHLEFTEKSTEEDRAAQKKNSGDLQKVPLESPAEC